MLRKFKRVILGGTFDTLHAGHVKLITIASLVGDELLIGLTSDEFASKHKKYRVKPFIVRYMNLRTALSLVSSERKFNIFEIHDPYGPSITEEELDAIVVSLETLPRAFEINDMRVSRGLRPLHIVSITFVRDGYGKVLSSTYVREVTLGEGRGSKQQEGGSSGDYVGSRGPLDNPLRSSQAENARVPKLD